MTTHAATATKHTSIARPRPRCRQTFLRAVRSEWIKTTSLRSTWVTSAIAIALTVLLGAGIAVALSTDPQTASKAKDMVVAGSTFGQIVVAVLGALVITSEYGSGQIRSSLAAVPNRNQLLAAKAVVLSVFSFLMGTLSMLLAWAVSAPFMKGNAGSLTDAHYLGYFWGTGLSFTLIALMALGLGFLLRSTAGTISLVITLMFVLSIPLGMMTMKWEWARGINNVLPQNALLSVADPFSLTKTWGEAGSYTLTHGWMVLISVAWAVVPLLAGWVALLKRDA